MTEQIIRFKWDLGNLALCILVAMGVSFFVGLLIVGLLLRALI